MDFTPLINQVLQVAWFLVPLAIIAAVVKSAWFKGMVGEFFVNLTAKLRLNSHNYHLLKNVTLPTEDGTTQIDHIIVSRFGVFVVETKNMKGWIFGSKNQKQWTQQIYKHKTTFQNPLHQNYKHVQTLKTALALKDNQIHSLIVFAGDSTFKTDMPDNVTKAGGYIRYVKSKTEQVIDEDQVSRIVDAISSNRLAPSFKTNREHKQHVRHIVDRKDSEPECPKCGAEMVLRTAKSGKNVGNQFWGCSKFPKCRGTRASSEQ